MKFSNKEDINAPIDHVFAQLTRFEVYEELARERGAQVTRSMQEENGFPAWDVIVQLRGKPRSIRIEITGFDDPQLVAFHASTKGIDTQGTFELVRLSNTLTRYLTSLELKPTTLNGRLFLQTLRMSKQRLTRAYKKRLSDLARQIEDGYSG